MIFLCVTDEAAHWQYTPRCTACGRWCRDYHDEWNGDLRCTPCALAEPGLTEKTSAARRDEEKR